MRDGLFKVSFRTQVSSGDGVVYLREGKVHGGDSTQYYVGDYTLNGEEMTARVVSKNHSRLAGHSSVFGVDTAHITLTGTFKDDAGQFEGTAKEAPGVKFAASLQRIAD